MTTDARDEVWVRLTRDDADEIARHFALTPTPLAIRTHDAIRAALERMEQPWVFRYCDTCTVEERDVCRCGKPMTAGLVVPLGEEKT